MFLTQDILIAFILGLVSGIVLTGYIVSKVRLIGK
jgi:hypothetical protein